MQGLFNNVKTAMLMGLLMGLCLGIGYLIGGPTAMTYALVIGLVMNGFAYFFSDRIALATMRAREISRDDDPGLWEMVRMLAERANLPMPRVYVSPASAPNAFATGRNPHHAAVCVTVGLRRMLNDEELAGVVAHELSHVKNRDILISAIATVIASAISYLAYMALWFGGGDDDDRNPLVGLLLVLVAPIAAGLIQMAISRSREFEADRTGAELVGSPRGLARALEKLHQGSSQIPLAVPDAQANMFIVAPLTGRKMARMFSTHPPVEQRVARLMEMDRQMV